MKLHKSEFVVLDTGTYAATVKGIEETTGQFGPQLQWEFLLDDGSSTLRTWSSQSLSAKSKLGRWTRAILGDIPEELDTQDLIGKPCRLSVVIKAREDGSETNRIDEVLAPRAGQKARPMPEPEPEKETEIPF